MHLSVVTNVVLRLLSGGVVAYGVVVLLLWSLQEHIAFPAPRGGWPEPSALGVPAAERVAVVTADGVTLRGWYLAPSPPGGGTRSPALIWFHGNAETVAALAPVLRALRPPGVAVLALDYRGYGASDGRASEPGIYRDAAAAWAWLVARPDVDPARIAVYGRSIGAAPALHLATARPVRAVILDSPFTTARAIARRHYWFVPPFALRLTLDNLARARALHAPLLVFHGTHDLVFPLAMGRALADAGRARELVIVHGAGHNDLYDLGGRRYRDKLHAFIQRELGG